MRSFQSCCFWLLCHSFQAFVFSLFFIAQTGSCHTCFREPFARYFVGFCLEVDNYLGVRTDCWRVFYECFVFFGAASAGEACWVLFRFLYWGQLADPCLIIHIDDVGWSVVSERFV